MLNGCPCGYATDGRRRCICPPQRVQQYLAKVSGPLLDRIDVHVEVPAVPAETLIRPAAGEASGVIQSRILEARARQQRRLAATGALTNARMRHREVQQWCGLHGSAAALMRQAVDEWRLSARAYDKLLRLARTIADLAASESIQSDHLAEALQYRSLDRRLWG